MEKSGKKFCGRTDAKMINAYQWEGFGIGCGNLGLSLMLHYLYKDNIFMNCVTES